MGNVVFTMLHRFRERSPHIAAALVVMLALVGVPHSVDPGHDAGHGVVLVTHDESAHQMRPAASHTDTNPRHCLVCHLSRTLRSRPETRTPSAPVIEVVARIHLEIFTAPSAAPVDKACFSEPRPHCRSSRRTTERRGGGSRAGAIPADVGVHGSPHRSPPICMSLGMRGRSMKSPAVAVIPQGLVGLVEARPRTDVSCLKPST